MHCDQCGKENRSGSKFCRSCGAPLTEGSGSGKRISNQKFSWKNPIVVLLIVVIILGGVSFGGYKAYAYYQVQSKISSAKKLQGTGDFSGSISALNNLGGYSPTIGQQNDINSVKADDQKFLTFKTSFDAGVALENASSTATSSVSANMQAAIADFQSIDSSYPLYKNVQAEMTKAQNSLVTALQSDADASKKAAADAKAQAASAQAQAAASAAAKTRAEANAEKAQSEAAQQTAQQQEQDVLTSFVNQLQAAYTDFNDNAVSEYNSAIDEDNAGQSLVAIAGYGQVIASDNGVYGTVSSMLTNFTNLPDSYTTAAKDLEEAAYYETEAAQAGSSADASGVNDSSTINYYSGQANSYKNAVHVFLSNPQ